MSSRQRIVPWTAKPFPDALFVCQFPQQRVICSSTPGRVGPAVRLVRQGAPTGSLIGIRGVKVTHNIVLRMLNRKDGVCDLSISFNLARWNWETQILQAATTLSCRTPACTMDSAVCMHKAADVRTFIWLGRTEASCCSEKGSLWFPKSSEQLVLKHTSTP